MRKKKVLFLAAFLSLQVVFFGGIAKPETVEAKTPEIQTFTADKIVIKYRTYNGRLQYRRWNDSKQCWVDKNWIYV